MFKNAIFVYYNINIMLEFTTIKDVKENFGEWCKLLRKNEKLTQHQLANELSLSPLTISKLERGENPTIETLLKVLQHFDEMKVLNNFVSGKIENLKNNQSLY